MRIERLEPSVFVVPTDSPESDGTLEWDRTTVVVVEAFAGGKRGLGYTYASAGAANVVRDALAKQVVGIDPMDVPRAWTQMTRAVRNQGRAGIAWMAVGAVDAALWDLKARLLGVSLAALLGRAHDRVELYGSGGFTSYPVARLEEQLRGWSESGFRRVKMKIGRDPSADEARARAARRAIGGGVELFVDANGAYGRKQAIDMAARFADLGVRWFEEPVSSDDLEGLRLVRERADMDVAAGEYGFDLPYFRRMLDAGAVDVLQADATRCGGITGLLQVAALCAAHGLPLSTHCAPALHLHVACAMPVFVHMEWFYDHVRLEPMLFDGVRAPRDGALAPDVSSPGNGLELKRADAARFAA